MLKKLFVVSLLAALLGGCAKQTTPPNAARPTDQAKPLTAQPNSDIIKAPFFPSKESIIKKIEEAKKAQLEQDQVK